MVQLAIFEILERAEAAPDEWTKVTILRENNTRQLRDVLIGAFDARVHWLLPSGPVPYRPAKPETIEGLEMMLYAQTRSFYVFIDGGGAAPGLTQTRREVLFIQLLESLHPKDAIIMIDVKDKKLPYPSITGELINKAFPNLLALKPAPQSTTWTAPTATPPPLASMAARQASAGEQSPGVDTAEVKKQPPEGKRGRGRPKGAKNKPKLETKEEVASVEDHPEA